LEHEEQLGEELISDPYFNNAGAWVVSTNWTISGNGEAVYDNLSNGSFYHEDAVPIVVGKRYKLTFTVGDGLSLLLYPSRQIGVQAWNEFTTSDTYESNTTYSFYVTSLSGVATLGFRAYTGGNAGKLTYFSVKEVLVEPTSKILHVTAKDGVARNLLSGDVIGDSILVNDHFDDTSEWSLGDGWSIANGKASCDGTQSTFSVIEDLSCGTETGKEYNIVYKLSGVSAGTVRYVNAGGSNHYGDWISEDGVYQDTFISTGATFRMQADADFIGSVEYIIVQEIIPEVTNTDIEVVKDGAVRVPRFNGDTSKIDCGSYNDLTGDITVLAWIKYTEDDDEILAYRNAIFSNAKFGFAQRDTDALAISRDGFSTSAISAYNVLKKNEWNHCCIVSKSNGITLIYANGKDETSSGNAGTPLSSTVNMIIGETGTGSREFEGDIAEVIVIDGLLTPEEISAYYSSTKHLYNK
jgi:hypothetical protein